MVVTRLNRAALCAQWSSCGTKFAIGELSGTQTTTEELQSLQMVASHALSSAVSAACIVLDAVISFTGAAILTPCFSRQAEGSTGPPQMVALKQRRHFSHRIWTPQHRTAHLVLFGSCLSAPQTLCCRQQRQGSLHLLLRGRQPLVGRQADPAEARVLGGVRGLAPAGNSRGHRLLRQQMPRVQCATARQAGAPQLSAKLSCWEVVLAAKAPTWCNIKCHMFSVLLQS